MKTKRNERFGDFRCFGELVAINQNFNAITARVAQKQRSISAIQNLEHDPVSAMQHIKV